jgi:hypothetical protein
MRFNYQVKKDTFIKQARHLLIYGRKSRELTILSKQIFYYEKNLKH